MRENFQAAVDFHTERGVWEVLENSARNPDDIVFFFSRHVSRVPETGREW